MSGLDEKWWQWDCEFCSQSFYKIIRGMDIDELKNSMVCPTCGVHQGLTFKGRLL